MPEVGQVGIAGDGELGNQRAHPRLLAPGGDLLRLHLGVVDRVLLDGADGRFVHEVAQQRLRARPVPLRQLLHRQVQHVQSLVGGREEAAVGRGQKPRSLGRQSRIEGFPSLLLRQQARHPVGRGRVEHGGGVMMEDQVADGGGAEPKLRERLPRDAAVRAGVGAVEA